MEDKKNWDGAQYGANPQDWQQAQANQNQWEADDHETSEPLNAFGDYSDDSESLYASSASDRDDQDDDVDDDDDSDDEADNEDEVDHKSDWGDIDPQSSPFPSSNDPTSPGSAV